MGTELAKGVGVVLIRDDVPLQIAKSVGAVLLDDAEVREHRVIAPKFVAYALLGCPASNPIEFVSNSFIPSEDTGNLDPDVPLAKVTCIMAQRNLLDYTQVVLESLKEKVVDTVDETQPSLQVARILREVFFLGLANRNWPHKFLVSALQPLGIDTPTHLIIPSSIKLISSVRYNMRRLADNRDKYEEVIYLDPEEFLFRTNQRNSSEDNIESVLDVEGGRLFIRNDTPPTWWTSFNQDQVIFDSYDSEVEATIQASKQQVYVVKNPEFCIEDDFIPDLPEVAMPWFIAEAKSVAAVEVSQDANTKAEQQSKEQSAWLSRNARSAGKGSKTLKQGRKSIK